MPYKDPEQQREYMRKWIAQRRADFFEGKVCVKCGSDEYLQLDHIDRDKKVDHKVWSWSAARREVEIAKCQVLCEVCHKKKTFKDCGYSEHSAYRYNIGCRCEICTEANRVQQRQFRKSSREKTKQ